MHSIESKIQHGRHLFKVKQNINVIVNRLMTFMSAILSFKIHVHPSGINKNILDTVYNDEKQDGGH